ncbi:plasmid stabilization protein [Pararobbsia alpina]|uniref:Plasmid stabilization protein n=1 Tax=Pararobbsia alpina TaxID=621374 RepID=A0A6S7C6E1_9BURK|nr:plasmid stabilization protein [Pararobbsia alpina]CAB3782183.1 hypothetical protein LMG28138_01458 [Pararobbsia alpina]
MKARARLSIELGEARLRWDQWCAQRGLTPQAAARQLILDVLQEDASLRDPVLVPVARWADSEERHHPVFIQLTPSAWTAVKQRAAASGFTGNHWIVALVRAHLAGEPQFDERELRLLATSNQQLAGIVRLLGGLARDLEQVSDTENTSPREGTVNSQQFEEVKKTLDTHLRAVAALMRANLDRWRL